MDEWLFLPSRLLLFRAQMYLPLKIQYPGGEEVFCCFQLPLGTFHSDLTSLSSTSGENDRRQEAKQKISDLWVTSSQPQVLISEGISVRPRTGGFFFFSAFTGLAPHSIKKAMLQYAEKISLVFHFFYIYVDAMCGPALVFRKFQHVKADSVGCQASWS